MTQPQTARQARARTTAKGRAYVLLNNARSRANRNGASVTIDIDWIVRRIERGTCALTGLPFSLSATEEHSAHPFAPSLDRIDNACKDYSPENTRVILHSVNSAMNEYGVEHLLMICDAIRAHTPGGVALDL